MSLLIALISIITIAFLATIVRASTPIRACPVCVGVSGTWIWMLVARAFGWVADPIILAVLIGGSVVGIAYQLDSRIGSGNAWFKVLFVAAGFVAAYGAATQSGTTALGGVLATAIIIGVFAFSRGLRDVSPTIVADAEKKLEDCCS